jgi:hypothetical protein
VKTCASCRFFAAPRPLTNYMADPEEESAHHSCVRIIHGNGDAQRESSTQTEPALVVDGSGYAARLIVLPTFGCVLHEEGIHKERDDG